MGRELYYEGKELQDFVGQENKPERDERTSEREIELAKVAAEKVKLVQQREIELAKVEPKIAKENEFELARLTGEEANK